MLLATIGIACSLPEYFGFSGCFSTSYYKIWHIMPYKVSCKWHLSSFEGSQFCGSTVPKMEILCWPLYYLDWTTATHFFLVCLHQPSNRCNVWWMQQCMLFWLFQSSIPLSLCLSSFIGFHWNSKNLHLVSSYSLCLYRSSTAIFDKLYLYGLCFGKQIKIS